MAEANFDPQRECVHSTNSCFLLVNLFGAPHLEGLLFICGSMHLFIMSSCYDQFG